LFSFFRVNDPLRILLAILMLVVLRLPYFLQDFPFTLSELWLHTLGEKQQHFLIYRDIEDNTEPLSAYTFWMINYLFGKSLMASRIIALILIAIQGTILNVIVNQFDVLKERNYTPILVFTLLSVSCFDFITLSPMLMASTFVIISLYHIFDIFKTGSSDQKVFMAGLFLGIASMFYAPSLLFALVVLFAFMIFSNVTLRRYLTYGFGVIFPSILISSFFYLREGLRDYVMNSLWGWLVVGPVRYFTFMDSMMFHSLIIVFFILGVIAFMNTRGVVQFQNRALVTIMLMAAFYFLVFNISFEKSLSVMQLFLPVVALIITFYFQEIKRMWVRFLLFTLFFWGTIAAGLLPYIEEGKAYLATKNYMLEKDNKIQDKKVLNLSSDFKEFYQNEAATRFFNWKISEKYFKNLDDFENVSLIEESFQKDMPDVIIDKEGIISKLFFRLPAISNQYFEKEPGVYYFREKRK